MRSCAGVVKIRSVSSNSISSPEIEEAGVVGHPRRLLHVVRDDDDGVVLLQLEDQLLDLLGRDRVERASRARPSAAPRAGCRARGRCRAAAAARPTDRCRTRRAGPSPRPTAPPAGGTARPDRADRAGSTSAVERRPVGDVVEDRLGERIGSLEDHPDPLPKRDEVGAAAEDRRALDQDVALVAAPGIRSLSRLIDRRKVDLPQPDGPMMRRHRLRARS